MEEKAPALFDHCVDVYNAMEEQSSPHPENPDVLVYEGFLTQLITGDLKLAIPYYSHTTKALKAMDCIRQIKRGGGGTPSVWYLLQTPTVDLYLANEEKFTQKRQSKTDMLEQQVADLRKRVQELANG